MRTVWEGRRLDGGGWKVARAWEEKEGGRLIKCYSYPVSFPTRGPASLFPSLRPARHHTLLLRPAFSLFPGPLPRNSQRKEGRRAREKSCPRWVRGWGIHLEQILGCWDQHVSGGETEAQRDVRNYPKCIHHGDDRARIRIQFSDILTAFYWNSK